MLLTESHPFFELQLSRVAVTFISMWELEMQDGNLCCWIERFGLLNCLLKFTLFYLFIEAILLWVWLVVVFWLPEAELILFPG